MNEMDGFISGMNSKAGSSKSNKGQYFIDQSTGQYYFQAEDGDAMTVVNASGGAADGKFSVLTMFLLNLKTILMSFQMNQVGVEVVVEEERIVAAV